MSKIFGFANDKDGQGEEVTGLGISGAEFRHIRFGMPVRNPTRETEETVLTGRSGVKGRVTPLSLKWI